MDVSDVAYIGIGSLFLTVVFATVLQFNTSRIIQLFAISGLLNSLVFFLGASIYSACQSNGQFDLRYVR